MSLNVVVLGSVLAGSPSSSRLKFDKPEPVVVNAKSWASFGCASLMIVIDPRLTLTNVHLMVSPAARRKVALRVATSPSLLLVGSSQEIEPRSNGGAGSFSVEVYVPGSRLSTTICSPSWRVPAASPVKTKLPAEPSGSVCFSTMILPSLVLVYLQVTCSLAATLIVATPVSALPVESSSLQWRS